jgi:hypothetical protein
MYTCNICGIEATVDHVNPPKFNCECIGAKVITEMTASMHGVGGVSEAKESNNNLSDTSAAVVKQMMSMVLGVEFFQENKKEVFARDVVIHDTASNRKFSFTLTAQELCQDSQE